MKEEGRKEDNEEKFGDKIDFVVVRERMKIFWWNPRIFVSVPPKTHLSKLEKKQ